MTCTGLSGTVAAAFQVAPLRCCHNNMFAYNKMPPKRVAKATKPNKKAATKKATPKQTSSAPTSPSRNTRSNTTEGQLFTPEQPPKIPTTDTGNDDAHEMDNARQTDNATTTDVNQDGVTTAAKPASASVTPTKSPPSNGDSPTQDYDEDSSVEEITKVQVELPPPSINDNASFEDLFPFVTNKSQVSSPNKGNVLVGRSFWGPTRTSRRTC